MTDEAVRKNWCGRNSVPGYLDFAVSVAPTAGVATVRVVGELDTHTAPHLRATFADLVAEGTRHVTVDLSDTSFVDSTGLAVLVGGLKRFRTHDGDMVVRSPSRAMVRLFEMTGLDDVFTVVGGVASPQ